MTTSSCAIAADTKLETPEGPLTIKTVGASPTAVMTRADDGVVRFAMSSDVRKVAEAQPVLRIALANGRALRVGREQILLTRDLQEVRAGDLRPGDELLDAFAFPAGYEYRTDDGETRTSQGTVTVVAVEPGGEADLFSLKVARTGRFVFSSGAIGKAEP
jgi:intein/homing endonuclease